MTATAVILPPGETLGGFRIREAVGLGGMAVVYRAEQLSLNREVALKVLSPELGSDEVFSDRFRREGMHVATARSSKHHPDLRRRQGQGAALPGHAARRRDDAGRTHAGRAPVGRGNRAYPRADRRWPRCRARNRTRSSRHQAAEHPGHGARSPVPDGLWCGEAGRVGRADRHGRVCRKFSLCRARTGPRDADVARHRCLRPHRRPLPVSDWRGSLSRTTPTPACCSPTSTSPRLSVPLPEAREFNSVVEQGMAKDAADRYPSASELITATERSSRRSTSCAPASAAHIPVNPGPAA